MRYGRVLQYSTTADRGVKKSGGTRPMGPETAFGAERGEDLGLQVLL
jgi:hypothetical protein